MSATQPPVAYQPDILGAGYEQAALHFPDDYEGKVIATLIRKKSPAKHTKSRTVYSWLY